MKISKARLQQLILEETAKYKKNLSEDAVSDETLQTTSISDELRMKIKAVADALTAAVAADATSADDETSVLSALAIAELRRVMAGGE